MKTAGTWQTRSPWVLLALAIGLLALYWFIDLGMLVGKRKSIGSTDPKQKAQTIITEIERSMLPTAAISLRLAKIEMESHGRAREDYLSFLDVIRQDIDPKRLTNALPYDLAVKPEEVEYGLFAKGNLRLEGAGRETEIGQIIGELKRASLDSSDIDLDFALQVLVHEIQYAAEEGRISTNEYRSIEEQIPKRVWGSPALAPAAVKK